MHCLGSGFKLRPENTLKPDPNMNYNFPRDVEESKADKASAIVNSYVVPACFVMICSCYTDMHMFYTYNMECIRTVGIIFYKIRVFPLRSINRNIDTAAERHVNRTQT
jgi:hypothetical protein